MFKSKPIIHLIFMIMLEFLFCYGLSYAIVYAADRPDGHINYAATTYTQQETNKIFDIAGNKYRIAFNKLDFEQRHRIEKESLADMSIPYKFTEKEFKNCVWLLSWVVFGLSMFIFFIITLYASETREAVAAPIFCKLFACLLTALPNSVNNPIRARKIIRHKKTSELIENFINFEAK